MDHAAHAPPMREIGDELYALAPSAFTAARDAQVARARAGGDRRTATALAAMKRPTVAGWLVNLVALARPDLIDDLTNLGATIRGAQGSVAPAALRDLSAQRRRMIDALLAQARTLARSAGVPEPSRQHLAEAEATFAAAMADEGTAGLVRSGRVLKAVSYSGFGQPVPPGEPTGGLADEPAGARPATRPADSGGAAAARSRAENLSADGQARQADERDDAEQRATEERATEERAAQARAAEARRAEEARAAARARVAQAQSRLERAARAERDENTRVQRLVADIAELRQRLAAAQHDAHAATQASLAAERDLASARRRLDRHG